MIIVSSLNNILVRESHVELDDEQSDICSGILRIDLDRFKQHVRRFFVSLFLQVYEG